MTKQQMKNHIRGTLAANNQRMQVRRAKLTPEEELAAWDYFAKRNMKEAEAAEQEAKNFLRTMGIFS